MNDNYPKYPLYMATFKWVQMKTEKREHLEYEKKLNLKNEECVNFTCYGFLRKKEFSKTEKSEFICNQKMSITKHKGAIRFIKNSVILKEYESWCLKWFNHYTFRDGTKDATYYRNSFEDFVNRKELKNEKLTLSNSGETEDNYCFMGADDRWRWESPCSCENCISRDLVYIDH